MSKFGLRKEGRKKSTTNTSGINLDCEQVEIKKKNVQLIIKCHNISNSLTANFTK